MGYRCPVCEDPQPDGEHLANHMAFTGLLGDAAHEAWLDETVPSWPEMDPDSLGEHLTEVLPDVELEELETDPARSPGRPEIESHTQRAGEVDLDPETAAALEEARELTREMYDMPQEGDGDADAEESTSGRDPQEEDEFEGEDR